MTSSSANSWRGALANASRRSLLQTLGAGALAVSPLAWLVDDTEARKKRKKSRRKKKRKNQQPISQVRADATCSGPQTNATILFPEGLVAQSFTAGQTGLLVRAELELQHQQVAKATGTLFLRLAPLVDAFPGTDALASAEVAASSVQQGINRVSFAFPVPATVRAGTSYALVLSRDGDGDIAWSNPAGAPCPGRSFVTTNITEPLEPRNNLDLIYTTFVRAQVEGLD